jgi:hypothetical protein
MGCGWPVNISRADPPKTDGRLIRPYLIAQRFGFVESESIKNSPLNPIKGVERYAFRK